MPPVPNPGLSGDLSGVGDAGSSSPGGILSELFTALLEKPELLGSGSNATPNGGTGFGGEGGFPGADAPTGGGSGESPSGGGMGGQDLSGTSALSSSLPLNQVMKLMATMQSDGTPAAGGTGSATGR